jgi:hypothetical protein
MQPENAREKRDRERDLPDVKQQNCSELALTSRWAIAQSDTPQRRG